VRRGRVGAKRSQAPPLPPGTPVVGGPCGCNKAGTSPIYSEWGRDARRIPQTRRSGPSVDGYLNRPEKSPKARLVRKGGGAVRPSIRRPVPGGRSIKRRPNPRATGGKTAKRARAARRRRTRIVPLVGEARAPSSGPSSRPTSRSAARRECRGPKGRGAAGGANGRVESRPSHMSRSLIEGIVGITEVQDRQPRLADDHTHHRISQGASRSRRSSRISEQEYLNCRRSAPRPRRLGRRPRGPCGRSRLQS